MSGLELIKEIPFREVYIHGTVRDETGTKMSKSLGNVIDPLEIIDEFGADALRFSIISITAQGQDVYLSRHRFETGRNFCNKIWNASRFLLMNLEADRALGKLPAGKDWTPDDWFIVGRLQCLIKSVTADLKAYRFKEAAGNIYEFFWHDLCDKYIEVAKPTLYGEDAEAKKVKQRIIFHVLENTLRLLHPVMPFITEELWQRLRQISGNTEVPAIMVAAWPKFTKKYYREEIVNKVQEKFELIHAGRSLRNEYSVPPASRVDFFIKPVTVAEQKFLIGDKVSVAKVLGARELTIEVKFKPQTALPAGVTPSGTIYMSLAGLDTSKERARLDKELAKINKELESVNNKLKNNNFISRAPKEVVAKVKDKRKEIEARFKKIKSHMEFFN